MVGADGWRKKMRMEPLNLLFVQPWFVGIVAFWIFHTPGENSWLLYRIPVIRRRDSARLRRIRITEGRFVLLAMFVLDGAYFKGISVLSQSVTITVAAVWVLLVVNPDLLVPTRRIIRQQHKQKNEESLPPDTYSPEWKGLVAMRDGLLRIFRRRR
jgi:hypothetical protein